MKWLKAVNSDVDWVRETWRMRVKAIIPQFDEIEEIKNGRRESIAPKSRREERPASQNNTGLREDNVSRQNGTN
jgi:hypothetical protein